MRSGRFPARLVPLATLVLAATLSSGCDLFGDDEGVPSSDPVMLTFRLEGNALPDGGWGYWYVTQGILYRRAAGQSFGPFGVTADCGTHAGIDALLSEDSDPAERIDLVIETVEDDPAEPTVAREEFVGPGLHQLAVMVTCR